MQKLISSRGRVDFEDRINKLFMDGWRLVPNSLIITGAVDWCVIIAVVEKEEKIENNPHGFL